LRKHCGFNDDADDSAPGGAAQNAHGGGLYLQVTPCGASYGLKEPRAKTRALIHRREARPRQMKAGKEHRVPLNERLTILSEMGPILHIGDGQNDDQAKVRL
jgi:hypothetical protein